MANKERGEFLLVAGDQTYKLRLTTNACAEIEDLSGGRTWDQVQVGLVRGSIKDVRLVFWGALREYHATVATDNLKGLQAVGKIIDGAGGFEGILEQLRAFMALNQDAGDQPPAEKGQAPTPDPPVAQDAIAGVNSVLTLVSSA